jgi:hypothetical protein
MNFMACVYDSTRAVASVTALIGDDGGGEAGIRVLVAPVSLKHNMNRKVAGTSLCKLTLVCSPR